MKELGIIKRIIGRSFKEIEIKELDKEGNKIEKIEGVGVEIELERIIKRRKWRNRRNKLNEVIGSLRIEEIKLILIEVKKKKWKKEEGKGIEGKGKVSIGIDEIKEENKWI